MGSGMGRRCGSEPGRKEHEVVVFGAGILAFIALGASWSEHVRSLLALRRIRETPWTDISGLHSLLEDPGDLDQSSVRFVAIRGRPVCKPVLTVKPRSPDTPVSSVVLVEAYIRNTLPRFLHRADKWLYAQSDYLKKYDCWASIEFVPVALMDDNVCVYVTRGEGYPLTLVIGNRRVRTLQFPLSDDTNDHPVAMSNTETCIQYEKEITTIGICRKQDGYLEIKPEMEFPYFMSGMTKEEMEADLELNASFYHGMTITIAVGALTVCVFGYAALRFVDWS